LEFEINSIKGITVKPELIEVRPGYSMKEIIQEFGLFVGRWFQLVPPGSYYIQNEMRGLKKNE